MPTCVKHLLHAEFYVSSPLYGQIESSGDAVVPAWAVEFNKNNWHLMSVYCVGQCAKYFAYIISFNPHGNQVSQLLSGLSHGWRN